MRFKGGWSGEPRYEEDVDEFDIFDNIEEPIEEPLDLEFEKQDRESIIKQLIDYFNEEVEVEIKWYMIQSV